MTLILITVLAIISIAAVILPFIRSSKSDHSIADESWHALRRSRNRVYEEIRVMHQERFLGHLTEQEFQGQLLEARTTAARYMKQQHDLQAVIKRAEIFVDQELDNLRDEADITTMNNTDGRKDH